MTYVITQNCCKDTSCVPACPVDCIRPVGGAGEFTGTEMLYIDPETCIDCGACLEVCPVNAIYYEEDLPEELQRFRDINAAYFQRHPLEPVSQPPPMAHAAVDPGSLRVAIVGTGPAACYAATELVRTEGVEVDLYERLPSPFGLIRAGVAPDHQHTKSVVDIFQHVFTNARVGCHLNVEIGRDLTHQELLDHHHAVIYATGASKSRDMGIPGEHLPGSYAAADFVGWYNGHPDHAGYDFDLSGERAVIVGNGNVALDVARVLLTSPNELAKTDIAQHALEALSHSKIREVVILGRRGPRDAAFSAGEFVALGHLPGVDVVVESDDLDPDPNDDVETVLKLDAAGEFAARATEPANKRIVFRFLTSPAEVLGATHVDALRVVHNRVDDTGAVISGAVGYDDEVIETSLVLRSIGYTGSATEGVPFDQSWGVVPNEGGRVIDAESRPVVGIYVTGWIKRGPRGVIGTNRACAEETVAQLWRDVDDGRLARAVKDRAAVQQLLADRAVHSIGWQEWRTIDAAERKRGSAASRPRVKFVDAAKMIAEAKRSAARDS